jgi:hypothetical protein
MPDITTVAGRDALRRHLARPGASCFWDNDDWILAIVHLLHLLDAADAAERLRGLLRPIAAYYESEYPLAKYPDRDEWSAHDYAPDSPIVGQIIAAAAEAAGEKEKKNATTD